MIFNKTCLYIYIYIAEVLKFEHLVNVCIDFDFFLINSK